MIHSRHSIRLPSYDYTSSGAYFITLCTLNHEQSLGEIINHEMILSRFGEIVSEKWFDIPNHHKHVELGEFIIMPNHIHGIIWIVSQTVGASLGMTDEKERVCRGKPRQEEIYSRKFGKPQSGSLSMIINHFKGSVKRWCNQNEYKGVLWQRNYYEHVILNDKELNNISEYIKINPQNWSKDEYKI
ncbi:MAG: hypothetical protein PF570_06495 [Candidatus Cloacimonetes bacterium]|nr:hypothetical protein [Candidatus Cloacimonadota bacterium]